MEDDHRQVIYPEAWKAKDRETGLRLRMPDKVTHTKVLTWEEMIALVTKHYEKRKDYQSIRTKDGITITWTDWPPEELALRSKHCPHCFLDWGQAGYSSHWAGCPNGRSRK